MTRILMKSRAKRRGEGGGYQSQGRNQIPKMANQRARSRTVNQVALRQHQHECTRLVCMYLKDSLKGGGKRGEGEEGGGRGRKGEEGGRRGRGCGSM